MRAHQSVYALHGGEAGADGIGVVGFNLDESSKERSAATHGSGVCQQHLVGDEQPPNAIRHVPR
jgi:hypothetical protein